MKTVIKNATIVNEGKQFQGDVLIEDDRIAKIASTIDEYGHEINAEGLLLIPGVIDDQVHFREPGLTHKADIFTESRAAAAGGITSFMEMPNTVPNTLTQELLAEKYHIGEKSSLVNYSFFMGASNDNIEEVLKTDPKNVCGVKVFMGSSTGNMLVDEESVLENIFSKCNMLIATHCEDEATIRANIEKYRAQYGQDVPIACHPDIRSAEACYLSSSKAVELARRFDTRLHILHISTEKEIGLFRNDIPLEQKRITAEACVHHLWFSDEDYEEKGTRIKWNPAVKTARDRDAVFQAVLDNKIDIIATDHAPHTEEEKNNTYFDAPSGGPLVQHALPGMMEHVRNGKISIERMVEKMCHAPAICFQVHNRGFIREGYFADLVLIDPRSSWKVGKDNILYKCGWSPFEGTTFHSNVFMTFVNGEAVYAEGRLVETNSARRLTFDR